jgi:hypothetical protein
VSAGTPLIAASQSSGRSFPPIKLSVLHLLIAGKTAGKQAAAIGRSAFSAATGIPYFVYPSIQAFPFDRIFSVRASIEPMYTLPTV